MATLKEQLSEAKAQAEALQTQLDESTAHLNEVTAELETRNAELRAEQEKTESLSTERDEAQSKAGELEKSLSEAKEATTKAEAERDAAKDLLKGSDLHGQALAGEETPLDGGGDGGTSPKTAKETYRQLQKTDPTAATKYWRENKAAILGR